MITIKKIKEYYEVESGIKDLSVKSRKRNIVDVRFCYFMSAKTFTDNSLDSIAKNIKRDHATVLHGINKFRALYGTNSFTANKIYNKVNDKLKIISCKTNDSFDLLNCEDIDLLKQYYRVKHILLIEKTQQVISKLYEDKKDFLYKLSILPETMQEQLKELDKEDFKEFIERTELFIKVKNTLNKKI